jgi:hypothetical protein
MIKNIIPLSVVSVIVARFDANLDTRRFSNNDAMIHINDARLDESTGEWHVDATHISGGDINIIITPNLQIAFWANFDRGE